MGRSMNWVRGSFRLFLVVFSAWTLVTFAYVPYRQLTDAQAGATAMCEVRSLRLQLQPWSECVTERTQLLAGPDAFWNWFKFGGLLFWLAPPPAITAAAVALLALVSFVWKGFRPKGSRAAGDRF
jgi:hypothetical protein